MKKQNKAHAIMAMALLVLVVLACSAGDETDQANRVGSGTGSTDAKKFSNRRLNQK